MKTNKDRRFTGGGPRPDNVKHKQEEAQERQTGWASMSPVDQLRALDARLGKGVGAAKQRARIMATISRPKSNVVVKTDEVAKEATSDKVRAKDRRAQERSDRPNK